MRLILPILSLNLLAAGAHGQSPATLPQDPLTLGQAIKLGREHGISAVLAGLNEKVVNARVGQRRADLLPTIAGSASFTRQTLNLDEFGIPFATGTTPAFNLYNLRLRAAQTLFDASVIARLRAARDTAVASGLDAEAVGELAGATAGLAYLRVLSARETVGARESDSTIAATLLDQARKLVEAGVSPAIDATRSEVSFGQVRTQLEVARNLRDRANLDLLRALDLPPSTALQLADSLGLGPLDIPLSTDAAVAFALEHRPELAAERARTEAAMRSLSAIRYENLPSVGLNGAYVESGRETGSLNGTYNVQLLVSVPILDGFRRQTRAQEQRARVEAQQVREHDLANQVETDVRQAILDLSSAEQQVTIAEDRLQLAEQELGQAQERFRAGVAGSIETTNAQGSVIAARDALIQARVSFGTARVNAYRALGVIDQLH